jgi:phenylacetate-CoA ligase
LVFTTLCRQATPLLRYRTRDLAKIFTGECPCGRVHRRISRIKGRTDDMLIINGVNIYPSQIETVLMTFPQVGNNYLISLDKKGSLDYLTIKIEINAVGFEDDIRSLDQLKDKLTDRIKSSILIKPLIELHEPNSLPVSEGKAKRVIDNREKL